MPAPQAPLNQNLTFSYGSILMWIYRKGSEILFSRTVQFLSATFITKAHVILKKTNISPVQRT